MSWNNAKDFLIAELKDGSKLPVEYDLTYNAGTPQEITYKVIVLTHDRVVALSQIRKRMGTDNLGEATINFAPTGTCGCCGR